VGTEFFISAEFNWKLICDLFVSCELSLGAIAQGRDCAFGGAVTVHKFTNSK